MLFKLVFTVLITYVGEASGILQCGYEQQYIMSQFAGNLRHSIERKHYIEIN